MFGAIHQDTSAFAPAARQGCRGFVGDHRQWVTPVPIPNTEVKPLSPMILLSGKVGYRRLYEPRQVTPGEALFVFATLVQRSERVFERRASRSWRAARMRLFRETSSSADPPTTAQRGRIAAAKGRMGAAADLHPFPRSALVAHSLNRVYDLGRSIS